MCLSTVCRVSDSGDEFLFKNIAKVEQNGNTLVFTDIMGVRREIEAHILNIDLLENIILVKDCEN